LATGTDGINDGEKFSCDMTYGYDVYDGGKIRLGERRVSGHAGGLIQSGAAGVHAGIGQQGMEGTAAGETARVKPWEEFKDQHFDSS
jgi:hypothetical protein